MEQVLMINNGGFSAGGNFSGYTAKGKRIHLYGKQMESLGYTKDSKIDFPFYVIAEEKTYGARVDKDNNPVAYTDGSFTMTRLTALSVFKSRADIKKACVEDATLTAEIAHEINEFAKSLSFETLTPDALKELSEQSPF